MRALLLLIAMAVPVTAQELTPRQRQLLEQIGQGERNAKLEQYRQRLRDRRYYASRAKVMISARRNATIAADRYYAQRSARRQIWVEANRPRGYCASWRYKVD